MQNTIIGVGRKSLAALTVSALVLGTFAFSFGAFIPAANAAPVLNPTTDAATTVTSSDATLNGTNSTTAATDSSFWVSTSTFSTASATLPPGVYSTADLGAQASSSPFSAQLSSASGLPAVTSGTTYYYAAWTSPDGGTTWYPGEVMTVTTVSAPTITDITPVSGSTAGGTPITITGTEFMTGATVTVGGAPATDIVVASSTSITAVTPPGTAGAQDVVVTNTDGGTVTSTGGFTYVTPVTNTAPTTLPASAITSSDATLNGMNGSTAASDSSFWVSTSTFATPADGTPFPAGVYSTPSLGVQGANGAFSAQLSSVTGLPTVTPGTTYYYAAWTNVGGTWSAGAVVPFMTLATTSPAAPVVSSISTSTGTTAGGTVVTITGTGFTGETAVDFGTTSATNIIVNNDSSITATSPATTTPGVVDVTVTTPLGTSATSSADQFTYVTPGTGTIGGTVTQGTIPGGTLDVTSITPVITTGDADGTYADGWSYLFDITVPTSQPNLSMDFANWTGAGTIAAGGNMQISSAQATNTAPVAITAANTYSSPALDMVGNMSTSTPGLHVQVLVQVQIPINTVDGSYTTDYGVQTLP
jgi:hypothetical protein